MKTTLATEHPHVHLNAAGRPVIGSTGLELHILAEYWRLGWSIEELTAAYPYISMAELLDGLSYYMDHRSEIDRLIIENRVPPSAIPNG